MKTNIDFNELQNQWRKKMLKCYFIVVGIIFFSEVAIYLIMLNFTNQIQSTPERYIPIYILSPTLVSLICVLMTQFVMRTNVSDSFKNSAVLLCLLDMCLVVATFHGFFLVTSCIFALPIVISVMFDDVKLLRRCAVASVVYLAISIFSANLFDHSWQFFDRLLSALVALTFIAGTYALCRFLLRFGEDKNEIILKSAIKAEEMKHALKVDAMTGLYNHTEFYNRLETYFDEYKDYNEKLTVAVLDVDSFKNINDTYGHENGDQVLIRIADILKNTCGTDGHIFRYGGEEYAVICRHRDSKQMKELMNEVIQQVNDMLFETMQGEHFGVSCGVYEHVGNDITAQDLFAKADSAMYRAKQNGKNRCICYEEP